MFMILMCLFSGTAKKLPPGLQYTAAIGLHALVLSLVDRSILLKIIRRKKVHNQENLLSYNREAINGQQLTKK